MIIKRYYNKKDIINKFIILLIAILDINIFYLVEPTIFGRLLGNYQKMLLVIISMLYFAWTQGSRNSSVFMKKYLLVVCVSHLFIYVISTMMYSANKLHNVILAFNHYLMVFLAFPLLKYIRRERGYEGLLQLLNKVTFVLYILFISQSIVYNNSGVLFLNVAENFRDGMLRMSLKSMGNLMIIYNFYIVWCRKQSKHRVFSLVQLCLGCYCLLFVQQTRAFYFAIAISVSAIMLFQSKNPLKTLRNICIIAVSLLALQLSGILGSYFDSFGETSESYGNTLVRMEAITYFWNAFVKNPIIGHGIIASDALQSIRTGPFLNYFYADVGLIGEVAQIGLFSFVLYVWPVVHWTKFTVKNRKRISPFMIGVICYIFATTPTLICTSVGLCFMWPICIAMFAYEEEVLSFEEELDCLRSD